MRMLRGGAWAGWLVLLATAVSAAPYTMATAEGAGLYDGYPSTFLTKLTMPDYWQRDPAYGGFPNGGVNYCVPTAISNSIMWFDDHGYDDLVTNTADRKKDQYDLINDLAGAAYCNTNPFSGSSVTDYVPGLQNWFDQNSATPFSVKYAGLAYSGSLWTGDPSPDESWIKEELARCEDVILRVGWYTLVGQTLVREGGHGVTFVGWDDTDQEYDPGDLIIHDPDDGTSVVTHDNYGLSLMPINLGGMFGVQNFMVIDGYGGNHFAIIDGALAASPVPEPATLVIVGTGFVALVRRRRRAV